jgi:hypothetical protein
MSDNAPLLVRLCMFSKMAENVRALGTVTWSFSSLEVREIRLLAAEDLCFCSGHLRFFMTLCETIVASNTNPIFMTDLSVVQCIQQLIEDRRQQAIHPEQDTEMNTETIRTGRPGANIGAMVVQHLHNKYISDFNLVKIQHGNRIVLKTSKVCSVQALANAHDCHILGFVNENKRSGEFSDPIRKPLESADITFIGKSTRYTTLAPSPINNLL